MNRLFINRECGPIMLPLQPALRMSRAILEDNGAKSPTNSPGDNDMLFLPPKENGWKRSHPKKLFVSCRRGYVMYKGLIRTYSTSFKSGDYTRKANVVYCLLCDFRQLCSGGSYLTRIDKNNQETWVPMEKEDIIKRIRYDLRSFRPQDEDNYKAPNLLMMQPMQDGPKKAKAVLDNSMESEATPDFQSIPNNSIPCRNMTDTGATTTSEAGGLRQLSIDITSKEGQPILESVRGVIVDVDEVANGMRLLEFLKHKKPGGKQFHTVQGSKIKYSKFITGGGDGLLSLLLERLGQDKTKKQREYIPVATAIDQEIMNACGLNVDDTTGDQPTIAVNYMYTEDADAIYQKQQMPHTDSTRKVLKELFADGPLPYNGICPLQPNGSYMTLWSQIDIHGGEIGGPQERGQLIFIPHGKILMLPANVVHCGGYNSRMSNGNLRLHIYAYPGGKVINIDSTNEYYSTDKYAHMISDEELNKFSSGKYVINLIRTPCLLCDSLFPNLI